MEQKPSMWIVIKKNKNKFYQVEIEKITFFDYDAVKLEIQQLKDNHK